MGNWPLGQRQQAQTRTVEVTSRNSCFYSAAGVRGSIGVRATWTRVKRADARTAQRTAPQAQR